MRHVLDVEFVHVVDPVARRDDGIEHLLCLRGDVVAVGLLGLLVVALHLLIDLDWGLEPDQRGWGLIRLAVVLAHGLLLWNVQTSLN